MTLVVRDARDSDLDRMVELLGVLFSIEADFHPDPARQRRGLGLLLRERERAAVLVAERDGRVVGMVTAQLVISTAEGAPSAWLEDLVVDAAERRGGVGRALVAALEARVRAMGATRLQLLADGENAPALAFYARGGWAATRLVCLRRVGA